MSQRSRRFNMVWVTLALLTGTVEPILVKLGYRTAVTPLQLLLMKNLTAAVLILPLTRTWRWVGWTGVVRIGSASVLLMATNGCSLLALYNMPAVTVITIVTTTPAVVALVNHWRGADRLTSRFWVGFSLCFTGVLMTMDAFNPRALAFSRVGVSASAAAVICNTIYRVRMESLTRDFSPKLVSTYIFLINGSLALLVLAPFVTPIPAVAVPLGLWIGLAGAVANVAFLAALHLVGSTNISIFLMLERPLVLMCTVWILREPLSVVQAVGTVLVLVGIRLAQVRR